MKYRKKPIEVEAIQYDGDLINRSGNWYVPDWLVKAYQNGTIYYGAFDSTSPPCELYINTLEGVHHVSVGDYIIRGVKGELYPCKPDIFNATYEEITDHSSENTDMLKRMEEER
ncbi:MAG: hypothetical protein SOY97_06015 [Candidatus Metalachnospira sp.]|nr:hypothetical protein [Candidatus Metalachnospira sp.]